MTTNAPRKLTVAAGVSTKAIDWDIYPIAVNVPHNAAVPRNDGFNWNRKGDNAMDANTILVDVAAEAGNESFINRPRGKLVPYKTEHSSNNNRGQRYATVNPGSITGLGSHTTSVISSLR